MLTGTFAQPLDLGEGAPAPDRHSLCDRRTHLRTNPETGLTQWRLMSNCRHCCRWVSAVVAKFRKRLRRRFGPEVRILWAREDHPRSGAIHLHMAVGGLPPMGRKTRTGRWVKAQWKEVGGGWMDLGEIYTDRGKAGWYIGKYLAKRHDQSMAKGYRRWSRTQNFAPGIVMHYDPLAEARAAARGAPRDSETYVVDGWHHPVTGDLWAVRHWVTAAAP